MTEIDFRAEITDWPEIISAASKLQDGWCGEGSLEFSPRQLLLASILLSIGNVYGLGTEIYLKPPATVQVVVAGYSRTRHAIGITKANDQYRFVPEKWPDIFRSWAETCARLSDEEGENTDLPGGPDEAMG